MADLTPEDLAWQGFADAMLGDRAELTYIPATPDPDSETGLPSTDAAPSPFAIRGFWKGLRVAFTPGVTVRAGDVEIILPHNLAFVENSLPNGPKLGDEIRLGDLSTDRVMLIVDAPAVPSGVNGISVWKVHGSLTKALPG